MDASKARQSFDALGRIKPLQQMIQRCSPTGNHVVSMEWKLRVAALYESNMVSDPVKGSHAIYKVTSFI